MSHVAHVAPTSDNDSDIRSQRLLVLLLSLHSQDVDSSGNYLSSSLLSRMERSCVSFHGALVGDINVSCL